MTLSIRNMRPEDYDAVVTLWQSAGLEFLANGRDQRERITAELDRPENAFLVGEIGGQIVASVFGTHDGRKGWINRLAVHPDFQHHGFAEQMVRAAEAIIEAQGIEIIGCLIEADNQASKQFFQKIGYNPKPDIHYFSKKKHPWT
ncbi:MAG: hypothetical protein COY19_09165 [Candidatus Marinimicrobia bacterium CG_4_10_14_0_2_um_filter_48_9]|nr:MAG: hypothetical protein COY19_09165 [Candidatus Marinimicrobia bacterium CG_4_10_14_0_2_um_filter_48_9]